MPRTSEECVSEILARAYALGVAVLLYPEFNVVSDGVTASGFFSEDGIPTILVATDRPPLRWLGTLAHEFSHACQWYEGAPVWHDCRKGERIWDWLQGAPLKDPYKAASYWREVEADCERRTVRLLTELRSPIDLELYQRQANSYVHFYNIIPETRKWYAKGRGPYEVPEVLARANPKLDTSFAKTPAALRRELLKCV